MELSDEYRNNIRWAVDSLKSLADWMDGLEDEEDMSSEFFEVHFRDLEQIRVHLGICYTELLKAEGKR